MIIESKNVYRHTRDDLIHNESSEESFKYFGIIKNIIHLEIYEKFC